MEEIKEQLGKKIRDAREEKGLTQKELGKVIGYSPMAVSHFEKGIRELKISDLQRIAGILNKNLSYFLPPRTLFRAKPSSDPETAKSLKDFDKFIEQQKSK